MLFLLVGVDGGHVGEYLLVFSPWCCLLLRTVAFVLFTSLIAFGFVVFSVCARFHFGCHRFGSCVTLSLSVQVRCFQFSRCRCWSVRGVADLMVVAAPALMSFGCPFGFNGLCYEPGRYGSDSAFSCCKLW